MLDALVVCGQILSSAFLVYGGLLSLAELVSVEHDDFPGGSARWFAEGARSSVGFDSVP